MPRGRHANVGAAIRGPHLLFTENCRLLPGHGVVLARDAQAKQALIIAQRLSVCPCVRPFVCPRQLRQQRGEYGIRLFGLFLINNVLRQTFCHDQSVP